MLRPSLAIMLLAAIPAYAQETTGASAMERALRCVQAAMTDALLPVGVMREQIANAALARCFDEIEAAATAIAGSRAPAGKWEGVRAILRRELFDYAVQVAGPSHIPQDTSAASVRDVESKTVAYEVRY